MIATGLASALAAVGFQAPAQAETGIELPLAAFADLEQDAASGKVFVSGGATANGVAIVDPGEDEAELIGNLPGASGMAFVGSELFVALAAGDGIAVLDSSTGDELRRIATRPGTCPAHLAATEATLYFGYGCDTEWSGGIGAVALDDPAAEPVYDLQCAAVEPVEACQARFHRAPLLRAEGRRLLAGQLSLSQSTVRAYDIEPSLHERHASDMVGAHLTDLAFGQAGEFYSAAGSKEFAQAWGFEDFDRRGSYAVEGGVRALALSPNGEALALGTTGVDNDLYLYEPGGAAPLARAALQARAAAQTWTSYAPSAWRRSTCRIVAVSSSVNWMCRAPLPVRASESMVTSALSVVTSHPFTGARRSARSRRCSVGSNRRPWRSPERTRREVGQRVPMWIGKTRSASGM